MSLLCRRLKDDDRLAGLVAALQENLLSSGEVVGVSGVSAKIYPRCSRQATFRKGVLTSSSYVPHRDCSG